MSHRTIWLGKLPKPLGRGNHNKTTMPLKPGYDPNRAKGGKRNPPGGRPTKASLDAREASLKVWEQERDKDNLKLAKRWVKRALEDDGMLKDIRKTIVPDARQELDVTHKGDLIVKLIDYAVRKRTKRNNPSS